VRSWLSASSRRTPACWPGGDLAAPAPRVPRRPSRRWWPLWSRPRLAATVPAPGWASAPWGCQRDSGPGAALFGSLHRSLRLDAAILGDLVRPLSGPPLRVALQRSIRLARQVGCVLLGGPPVATAAGLANRRLLGLSGRGLGIGGATGGQRDPPSGALATNCPPDSVGAAPQTRLFRVEGVLQRPGASGLGGSSQCAPQVNQGHRRRQRSAAHLQRRLMVGPLRTYPGRYARLGAILASGWRAACR